MGYGQLHYFCGMLSKKEKDFIGHWEMVREQEGRFISKLAKGLPMALLFGLPILLSLIAVYFLSPEWYTKVSSAANGVSGVLIVAVMVTVLFFSYFRMHFKWEMNEQLYQELKRKAEREVQQ